MTKELGFLSFICASLIGSLYGEEASSFDLKIAEPAVCMMPIHQTRLQKTYITADRVFLNDNGIFFLDYNNTVQSTFGIFSDQSGLYVFTQEPYYSIMPMAK